MEFKVTLCLRASTKQFDDIRTQAEEIYDIQAAQQMLITDVVKEIVGAEIRSNSEFDRVPLDLVSVDVEVV
jgi:hypothetical protein